MSESHRGHEKLGKSLNVERVGMGGGGGRGRGECGDPSWMSLKFNSWFAESKEKVAQERLP